MDVREVVKRHNLVFDKMLCANGELHPVEFIWLNPFGHLDRTCIYTEYNADAYIFADDIIKREKELGVTTYVVYINCELYDTEGDFGNIFNNY